MKKSNDHKTVWFEITGTPFIKSDSECLISFDSFNPQTGKPCGFLDILSCWQALTRVLIESLETQSDPENLKQKLVDAFNLVLPNDNSLLETKLNDEDILYDLDYDNQKN